MNGFKTYHPIVNFIYFMFVIIFSMLFMHPICLFISLTSGFLYYLKMRGKYAIKLGIACLPVIIFTALINPAFNHKGVTILTYFPNGNPFTLESVIYGIFASLMLSSVILWFSCFNEVITSDKIIYLFSKLSPKLSLIFSMTLSFIPKLGARFNMLRSSQACLGNDTQNEGIINRAKTGMILISSVITWAFESFIDTADSMKSRGYGLKGRTAFSIYRFDERDKYTLAWLSLCGLFLVAGTILNAFGFRYFPDIRYAAFDMTTISFYCAYSALCITPVILNLKEERKWKTSVSEM